MTPPRRRLIEDLPLRNYAPGTARADVDDVAWMARFHGRSPDQISRDQVRSYLVQERKASWSHYQVTVCVLRFLSSATLERDWPVEHVPYARRPRRLPGVLTTDEVVSLLGCVAIPGRRMVLLTIYAAGLRVSEAARQRAEDINSRCRLIHVCQGKGAKVRMAPLSPALLQELRDHWRATRPGRGCFQRPIRRVPCAVLPWPVPVNGQLGRPGFGSTSRRVHCDTASRRISWKRESICGRSSAGWGTARCGLPLSTAM